MVNAVEILSSLGASGWELFWLPTLVWTLATLPLYIYVRRAHHVSAHWKHLMSMVGLVALPVGLILSMSIQGPSFGPIGLDQLPELLSDTGTNANSSYTRASVSGALQFGPDESGATAVAATRAHASDASTLSNETLVWSRVPGLFVGLLSLLVALSTIVGLGRFVMSWRQLRALRGELSEATDPSVLAVFTELKKTIVGERNVQLRVCASSLAPMTFGSLRPVVVLPQSLLDHAADDEELRISLIHELLHIQRHDYIVGTISRLVGHAGAWHPLVRRLSRESHTQREIACDTSLLAANHSSPVIYANTIVRASERLRLDAALSISSTESILIKRIKAMKTLADSNTSEFTLTRFVRARRLAAAALLVLLPIIMTACVDFTGETDSNLDSLMRLEAEVAYLDHEINAARDQVQPFLEGPQTESKRFQAEPSIERLHLLKSMRSERAYELEHLRMAVAVEAIMDGR